MNGSGLRAPSNLKLAKLALHLARCVQHTVVVPNLVSNGRTPPSVCTCQVSSSVSYHCKCLTHSFQALQEFDWPTQGASGGLAGSSGFGVWAGAGVWTGTGVWAETAGAGPGIGAGGAAGVGAGAAGVDSKKKSKGEAKVAAPKTAKASVGAAGPGAGAGAATTSRKASASTEAHQQSAARTASHGGDAFLVRTNAKYSILIMMFALPPHPMIMYFSILHI